MRVLQCFGISLVCSVIAFQELYAMTAMIEDYQGSPTIFINGKPEAPLFFCADPNLDPESPFLAQAKMAHQAGVRFYTFGLPMPWPRPGEEPDFSDVDQMMQIIVDHLPDALVMPRFSITAPHWWLDAHPGNEMLFSDSEENPDHVRWVSMASTTWRAEYLIHLKRFVEHLEERWGDHVMGYHPCNLSTAEWFYKRSWEPVHSGFEEPMRLGFIQWLQSEYDGLDALRTAWGDTNITWETIQIPSASLRELAAHGMFRDPVADRYVIDFTCYQQIAVIEPMEQAAQLIKEVTHHNKLVTYFYGYYFELANIPKGAGASGHLELDRLLRSPYVDILTSPISYLNRGAGGMNAFMIPVDSIRAAGKLFISEDDTRTMLTNPDTPFARITGTSNIEETHWEHRRNFGRLLPRRMGTWYMDLIGEGWLNDPEMWEEIARMWRLYDATLYEPASFSPEVAVIVDERSIAFLHPSRALSAPLLSFFREQWYRMGTDFRVHLLSDVLEKRITLPAVTLFLGCWNISDVERDTLHAALEGKTAVWFYGSGFQSEEEASAERMTALTGFSFSEQEHGNGEITFSGGHLLTEALTGDRYGAGEQVLSPRWSVEELPGVQPLAIYTDDGSVAVAARGMATWRSIYLGALGCPAQFLRNILRNADVHVYLDSDDVVATDGRFLTVSASSPGEKAILLPPGHRIQRIDAEAKVVVRGNHAIETFALGETRQYLLEPIETEEIAQYLVMQFTNIAYDTQPRHIQEMRVKFSVDNAATNRYLAFAPITPHTLRQSNEELQTLVNDAFDWAIEYDLPVYFQIDDMHFMPEQFAEAPHMIEWTRFPEPGETFPPTTRYWFNWGLWMFMPAIPSFESPALRYEIVQKLREGILAPISERLNVLQSLGREELFAGMAIGWETHIPNYTPGEPIYYIDAESPPVNTALDPPVQMETWEMGQTGYAALFWAGWDEARLQADAERLGISRDVRFREACFDIIQGYSAMLAREAYLAGIPRNRIFTHIVPMDSVEPTRSTVSPAIRTAVNRWSIPGFTMSPFTAPYNVETLMKKIQAEEAEQDQFICAESYFGGQNDEAGFKRFLNDIFGNNGTHLVIWGLTDPETSWYAGYPQDGAINAANAWLTGRWSPGGGDER